MCEKNLEGKVLSSSSTDTDDINDETIIDSDITDDMEEIVEKPKKKKRSYKKKKVKTKICKTCGQNILEMEKRDMFMFKDTYHQLRVKDYCKDHERTYGDHKCKPNWCGDCGYLVDYQIEIKPQTN